jgi:hypothetical protein
MLHLISGINAGARFAVALALAATLSVTTASASPLGDVSVRRISTTTPFADCGVDPSHPFYNWEGETTIASDPSDPRRIATAWLQDEAAGVVVASSRNGGGTWRHSTIPGLTRCTGGSFDHAFHPRLSWGPDGMLYLAAITQVETCPAGLLPSEGCLSGRVAFSRSSDGGRTWSTASFLRDAHGDLLNDMDSITAEPDVPGAVDIVWTPLETTGSERIYLSRSVDQGRTWTTTPVRTSTPETVAFNRVIAHPDGTLMVVSVDSQMGAFIAPEAPLPKTPLLTVRSEDKGLTWSAPTVLEPGDPFQWPAAAVGPDGTVYVSWRTVERNGEGRVLVAASSDAGKTWRPAVEAARFTVEPGGQLRTNLPHPGIGVDGYGNVAVLYNDRRNDVPDDGEVTMDVWLSHSHDGGVTWEESHAAGPFDFSRVPALGLFQELTGLPCGFAGTVALGPPIAVEGSTDAYFARAKGECGDV